MSAAFVVQQPPEHCWTDAVKPGHALVRVGQFALPEQSSQSSPPQDENVRVSVSASPRTAHLVAFAIPSNLMNPPCMAPTVHRRRDNALTAYDLMIG